MYSNSAKTLLDNQVQTFGYNFCERCEKSNCILDTHHIVYRSEAPKHPNLHDVQNLIIVCRDCHTFYHSKKDNRKDLVQQRNLKALFTNITTL